AAGREAGAGRGDVRGAASRRRREPEWAYEQGDAGSARRAPNQPRGASPAPPPVPRQKNKATPQTTRHASEKLGRCYEHRHQSEEQSNTTHRPARAKRMTAPRTLVRVRINKAALGRGDQSFGPDPWTKCQKQ